MKRVTLRQAREGKGWTQKDLEAASGIDQRNISRIERGDVVDPGISTVVALAAALGVDPRIFRFGQSESSAA